LELLILLFGVPVPLVNLLQFEASVFGQLFKLKLRWLALRILVAFLQLLYLITGFSVAFDTNQS
jgi:hypothetical protein